MSAVIFGAGNIGKGLVGDVLSSSGYQLTFVDADADLVSRLSDAGSYSVRSGDDERRVEVESVVNAKDEERVADAVAGAHIVATAVGAAVLRIVAPVIGEGLLARRTDSVNVIACENAHPNSSLLRTYVVEAAGEGAVEGVGFPDVVVDRIVPGDPGALDVVVEDAFEFVIDRTHWLGPTLDDSPIIFTTDLPAYKLRKLWLVNGLHAMAAWLGLHGDHAHIHEALADPEIAATIGAAGAAASAALTVRTDAFTAAELEAYRLRVLNRFGNDALPDITTRVARNPLAKLAAGERVMGPASAAEAAGLDITAFADGIVAGMTLDDPLVGGIAELREAVDASGWQAFVEDHCGVAPGGALHRAIEERMSKPIETRGDIMVTEDIVITNPAGLHARPAAEIVEQAKDWTAHVNITKGDKSANAKSIMSVLALGANTGDKVTVVAEGEDAQQAVEDLRKIMQATEH